MPAFSKNRPEGRFHLVAGHAGRVLAMSAHGAVFLASRQSCDVGSAFYSRRRSLVFFRASRWPTNCGKE